MAVPRTKFLTFETPSQRRNFAPHGREGYYIGPSLEHYLCYKTFLTDTNAVRDTFTLDCFPKQSFPQKSPTTPIYDRQPTTCSRSCNHRRLPTRISSPTAQHSPMPTSKLHRSSAVQLLHRRLAHRTTYQFNIQESLHQN